MACCTYKSKEIKGVRLRIKLISTRMLAQMVKDFRGHKAASPKEAHVIHIIKQVLRTRLRNSR